MKREVSQNLGTSLQLKVIHLGGQLSSLCQGKSSLQELLDDEDGEGDVKWRNPMPRRPYRSRGTPLGVVIFNEVWWCFRSWLLKLLLPSRMWLRSANRCCSLQATMWVGPKYTGQGKNYQGPFHLFQVSQLGLLMKWTKWGWLSFWHRQKWVSSEQFGPRARFPGVG